MRRTFAYAIPVAAIIVAVSAPAAHAQQTVNFTIGAFAPIGVDARVRGDVIVADQEFLAFRFHDFRGATVGGEWLVPLGSFLEAGAGVSFSRQTVPSVYWDYVADDGTEIEQDLRLRLVPVSFTLRLVPFGQSSPVQPYFGAGIAIVNWRYSETGDFIDFANDGVVYSESYVASGSDVGPVVLGGLRVAGDAASAGFEIRYQDAKGTMPSDFFGPRIDLGGWTYNFTVGVRF